MPVIIGQGQRNASGDKFAADQLAGEKAFPKAAFKLKGSVAMDISMVWLMGSFGGGALGAVMGALPSIILWGAILVVAGVTSLITGDEGMAATLALNPMFGGNVVFPGGIAALAYAARRGYVESGLDIIKPLVSLGKPDVLLVGGLFGVLGYFVEKASTWLSLPTDSFAFAILITGVIARIVFDKGCLKKRSVDSENKPKLWPSSNEIIMMIVMGVTVSIAGAFGSVIIKSALLPFGLALMFVLFLGMGLKGEPWHHIVLIAGITALQGGGTPAAMICGVVLGTLAAIMSGFLIKLLVDGTNSFVDPTVTSIAVCTPLIKLCAYVGII